MQERATVALLGIPLWIDQDIVLYHGTTVDNVSSILTEVDPRKGADLKDFGRGFYTTTRLSQASEWAAKTSLKTGNTSAVIKFTVSRNDLSTLDCLFFVRGDRYATDFWSFVQYCRTIGGDHNRVFTPWYDLVAGPVTGSWQRQTTVPEWDQISFHTAVATDVLNRSGKEQIE
jgi:hypothetical protein